ncbi:MAG: copper resistance protein CopC [Dehalococcoidia bacterium]|nr:copper resistance protein CopC [Dehalococcoidia bacterium]
MRLLPLAIGIGLLLPLVLVSSVFAHAEPVGITPGDGAVMATSPGEVVVQMSQEMARREGANDIDVFGPDGTEVTIVAAAIDNSDRTKIAVAIPLDLPVGTYEVRWKTLSAEDGDDASGTLSFTIDPSKPAAPGQTNLREDAPPPATETPAGDGAATTVFGGGGGGTSWVLVVAVAVGMFVLGSGTTFLLVQKQQP